MSDQFEVEVDNVFNGIKPERVWLKFHNHIRPGYLTVTLEVNGIDKVIREFLIIGLDFEEGHCSEHHNLTWLLGAPKFCEHSGAELRPVQIAKPYDVDEYRSELDQYRATKDGVWQVGGQLVIAKAGDLLAQLVADDPL